MNVPLLAPRDHTVQFELAQRLSYDGAAYRVQFAQLLFARYLIARRPRSRLHLLSQDIDQLDVVG
jgi:hypothetical protein